MYRPYLSVKYLGLEVFTETLEGVEHPETYLDEARGRLAKLRDALPSDGWVMTIEQQLPRRRAHDAKPYKIVNVDTGKVSMVHV